MSLCSHYSYSVVLILINHNKQLSKDKELVDEGTDLENEAMIA